MPSQASDRTLSVEGVETRRRPPKCECCNAYGEGIVQRVGKLTPIGILWSGVQVPDGPPEMKRSVPDTWFTLCTEHILYTFPITSQLLWDQKDSRWHSPFEIPDQSNPYRIP